MVIIMFMYKNTEKRGFTVIEVVLVLAIAGLIFLMVFLGLPALQRSQRDTQKKRDIASLGAAISDYLSSNRGAMPEIGRSSQYFHNINREGANIGFLTGYWKPSSEFESIEIMPPNRGWVSSVRVPRNGLVLHLGGSCGRLEDGTWTTGNNRYSGRVTKPRNKAAVYVILEGIAPAKNYYGDVGANYCEEF